MNLELSMRRQGDRLVPANWFSAEEIARVPAGRDVLVKITTPRNLKLQAFLWVLASKVAEACDWMHDREDAMDELKIRAKHFDQYIHQEIASDGVIRDVVKIKPRSLTKLDGIGLKRLAERMIYVVCHDLVPGMDEGALRDEVLKMVAGDSDDETRAGSPAGNGDASRPATREAEAGQPASQSESPASHSAVHGVAAGARGSGGAEEAQTAAAPAPHPLNDEPREFSDGIKGSLREYATELFEAQTPAEVGRCDSEFWKARNRKAPDKSTRIGQAIALIRAEHTRRCVGEIDDAECKRRIDTSIDAPQPATNQE